MDRKFFIERKHKTIIDVRFDVRLKSHANASLIFHKPTTHHPPPIIPTTHTLIPQTHKSPSISPPASHTPSVRPQGSSPYRQPFSMHYIWLCPTQQHSTQNQPRFLPDQLSYVMEAMVVQGYWQGRAEYRPVDQTCREQWLWRNLRRSRF